MFGPPNSYYIRYLDIEIRFKGFFWDLPDVGFWPGFSATGHLFR
jgi:hypothetical protein